MVPTLFWIEEFYGVVKDVEDKCYHYHLQVVCTDKWGSEWRAEMGEMTYNLSAFLPSQLGETNGKWSVCYQNICWRKLHQTPLYHDSFMSCPIMYKPKHLTPYSISNLLEYWIENVMCLSHDKDNSKIEGQRCRSLFSFHYQQHPNMPFIVTYKPPLPKPPLKLLHLHLSKPRANP